MNSDMLIRGMLLGVLRPAVAGVRGVGQPKVDYHGDVRVRSGDNSHGIRMS